MVQLETTNAEDMFFNPLLMYSKNTRPASFMVLRSFSRARSRKPWSSPTADLRQHQSNLMVLSLSQADSTITASAMVLQWNRNTSQRWKNGRNITPVQGRSSRHSRRIDLASCTIESTFVCPNSYLGCSPSPSASRSSKSFCTMSSGRPSPIGMSAVDHTLCEFLSASCLRILLSAPLLI